MTFVAAGVNRSPSYNSDSDEDKNEIVHKSRDLLPISKPLEQSLGCPGVPSGFKQISIVESQDVHFGDKNFYNGPVTIKQVVYANGDPLVNNDLTKNEGKIDEPETSVLRGGFIWLQNVSKHRTREIGICIALILLFLIILLVVLFLRHPKPSKRYYKNNESDVVRPTDYESNIFAIGQERNKLRIVSRYQWVAQPPTNDTTPLVTPVPYVIIHHTATENCSSQAQCVLHVRQIQTFHIESNGWYDIGYNFLVGGDGAAYEGRGWTIEGAHAAGWNYLSIGIALIGTFIKEPPSEIQMIACQKLIELGVEKGFIMANYTLFAARQLSGTESPGIAAFRLIETWPHWKKDVN
ncbi:hypothetical protein ABEB36_001238 [Hypothenemus hampei]|uniref:Uncharacterized protein n=1 Tax=Hypothenemus hampei TaxID=57062 RepID=A0ABD1FET0_HYPHA